MPNKSLAAQEYHASMLWAFASSLLQRFEGTDSRDPSRMALGLSVIIFAAMTIEAFLNELGELAQGGGIAEEMTGLGDALGEVEDSHGSIRLKLLTVGVALGRPIKKGEDPYQGFNLLFKVRDAIIHLKPHGYAVADDSVEMALGKLLDELYGRKLISDPKALPAQSLLALISTPAMCRWSLETAKRVIGHVVGLLPEGMFKKVATTVVADVIGVDIRTLFPPADGAST